MFDIITMGSNTVDVFVHTDQSGIIDMRYEDGCKEYISYPVGTKMLITRLMHNIGGNGANTAVSFSRLGLKTAYLGKIGKDHNGREIIKSLKKEGVKFIGARGDQSGFSVILDSIEDDRTILTYKGCNNDLSYKEIQKSKLKTKWLYITSMLGKSLDAMIRLAKYAKGRGIKIAFNPSSTILEQEPQAAINLLRYSDLLILNKEESKSITGGNHDSVGVTIRKLLVYGPHTVVVTDGSKGATAYHQGAYYKLPAKSKIKVVETTGAGDAFASALTAGMLRGKPFEFCLKMGINNAESVITHHGAQNLLLSNRRLYSIVRKDKRRIEKRKAK